MAVGNGFTSGSAPRDIMGVFSRASIGQASAAPTQSVLSKIMPKTTSAPMAGVKSLMRDPNAGAAGLKGAKEAVAGLKKEATELRGQMKAAHAEHRNAAVNFAKQVAADNPNLGISDTNVKATFAANGTPGVADIGMQMGLEAAGAGSAATILKVAATGVEYNADTNKMSSSQRADLMREMAIAANSPSQAQLARMAGAGAVQNTQISFEGFGPKDFEALLFTPFENLPEVVDLDNNIAALDKVEGNHVVVEQNLAQVDPTAVGDEFFPVSAAACDYMVGGHEYAPIMNVEPTYSAAVSASLDAADLAELAETANPGNNGIEAGLADLAAPTAEALPGLKPPVHTERV